MPLTFSETMVVNYPLLKQVYPNQSSVHFRLLDRIFEHEADLQTSADTVYMGLSRDFSAITLESTVLNASVQIITPENKLHLAISIHLPNYREIKLEHTTTNEETIHVCIDQLMLCISSNYDPNNLERLETFIDQYMNSDDAQFKRRRTHGFPF